LLGHASISQNSGQKKKAQQQSWASRTSLREFTKGNRKSNGKDSEVTLSWDGRPPPRKRKIRMK
jgi:hypothetical protein